MADMGREQHRMFTNFNAKLDPLIIAACRSVPPPIIDEAIAVLNTRYQFMLFESKL